MKRIHELPAALLLTAVLGATATPSLAATPSPAEKTNLAERANHLVEAARKGDSKMVATLLQQKADVNGRAGDGATALQWAVNRDDLEMADLLIRAGANPKLSNEFGVTPLFLAATNGNGAMIERLIRAGADPGEALTDGETPLMTASRTGKLDAVKALLDHGANINAQQAHGQTALMWAIDEQHNDVAKLLIARGADTSIRSNRDYTAFIFAARSGNMEMIKTLMDAGQKLDDPELRSPAGNIVSIALANSNYELAGFFLKNGAEVVPFMSLVKASGGDDDDDAGSEAAADDSAAGKMDRFAVATMLLERGVGVDARSNSPPRGRTASITTALKSAPKAANPDKSGGMTAYLHAAVNVDVAMMKWLLAHGADPKATSAHDTALMLAAGVGNAPGGPPEAQVLEAVKLAHAQGNDVNAVDDNGDTAMHGAVLRGNNSVVQYLADNGAKLSVKNSIGWTPLDLAEALLPGTPKYRPEPTARLLRQLGALPSTAIPVPARAEGPAPAGATLVR